LKKFAYFFNFFNRIHCDCINFATVILCDGIFDAYEKPNSELAELTRHDNKTVEVFRSRIKNLVDKYTEAAEELFKAIY